MFSGVGEQHSLRRPPGKRPCGGDKDVGERFSGREEERVLGVTEVGEKWLSEVADA